VAPQPWRERQSSSAGGARRRERADRLDGLEGLGLTLSFDTRVRTRATVGPIVGTVAIRSSAGGGADAGGGAIDWRAGPRDVGGPVLGLCSPR